MNEIETVEIQGAVPVLSDGKIMAVEWVNYRNRAWLAPLWIPSHDGQWIRPVRLIAPKMAPGHDPIPSVEVLHLFQQVQVPQALLENAEPPAVEAPLLEILELPELIARNPAAGH